ncbi:hypothetical protein GOC72_05025 [Sinorhizobium medicae]|uniref:hypothetical protein n=1 Tax=Sinorhizobium medicae TaxID=110321 RepID=UPI000FD2EC43|nr:hypothetical protein [Sinorhizobium medicae]MDX0452821.1 hypothetical protein [Sinorhizobium medicae]RVJ57995.1 hypothetical protein CN166_15880 [Sinorhizobium medicae]RVJ77422.1 hypothetical protein CN167_10925 [Sinorhizobium medicae]RVK20288.1 hypothetical protein CN165_10455 [Sinorhizobium medicae]WQO64529.1 hypothetical protein U8C40_15470 [Sinorhizobium medicae]
MISYREKANCAAREVKQRRRVYSRLVAEGRMRQQSAEHEIEVMQAIADDYSRWADEEELQTRLPL